MAAHTNVCVIGLGSMGMGAARACLQAGLNTWGVDINPDNCRALLAAGAKGAGPSAVPFAADTGCGRLAGGQCRPGAGDPVRRNRPRRPSEARHRRDGVVHHRLRRCQAIAVALAEYQLMMLDAPVSGGAVGGRWRHDGDGLRKRCRLCPPRAGTGRRGRQSLPHRQRHRPWLDGKDYSSAAGWGAYRCCRRSDGACRPRRDPLETLYDVVTRGG